jgi:hypothetical protein
MEGGEWASIVVIGVGVWCEWEVKVLAIPTWLLYLYLISLDQLQAYGVHSESLRHGGS